MAKTGLAEYAGRKRTGKTASPASSPQWGKMGNERIANSLTKPNSYLPLISQNSLTGEAELFYNEIRLSAASEQALAAFGESTGQVLDFILLKAHASHNFNGITTSLAEFMAARGIRDRKTAAKQLKEGLENLAKVRISFDSSRVSRRKKKTQIEELYANLGSFTVLANIPVIKKGSSTIPIALNRLYSPVLEASTPMAYHGVLLTLNTRLLRWAYPMGRKIFEHKDMTVRFRREGDTGEGRSPENILAVKTLFTAAGIPLYEETSGSLKEHYDKRIIEVFEANLNALDMAFSWEYCLENGEPVSGPVAAKDKPSLSILFHFKDYPSQAARLEHLKEEREKKEENRRKCIQAAMERKAALESPVIDVEPLPPKEGGEK